MSDWNDTKNLSMSFGVKPNEEAMDYFNRIIDDFRGFEEAINARMKQLFDENISVGGELKDEVYNQVLKVFMLGYGHGWNDYKSLTDKTNKT